MDGMNKKKKIKIEIEIKINIIKINIKIEIKIKIKHWPLSLCGNAFNNGPLTPCEKALSSSHSLGMSKAKVEKGGHCWGLFWPTP